jgi:serpin B
MKIRDPFAFGRLIGIAGLVLLLGAGVPQSAPPDVPPLSQRINAFTLDLLQNQAGASNAPANAVLSAQSIYHGLALSYIASGGTTRSELSRVCRFPADDPQFPADLGALRRQLSAASNPPRMELAMANAAWLDESRAEFRKEYVEEVAGPFDAPLHRVQFGQPERASSEINRWVSARTHGRIAQSVRPDDFAIRSRPGVIDEPALVTVSTLYFRSDWGSRFEKSATSNLPFHVNALTTADAWMMHQRSELLYAEDAGARFLEIPYRGGACSMMILLPKQATPVRAWIQDLTTERILELRRNAFVCEVDVLLPKFELRSQVGVRHALTTMGVRSAFDPRSADFDRMIVRNPEALRVYLTEIHHDAWIDVHEEGTEAAAATSTVHFSLGCSARVQSAPATFHADHPFVFLVVHNPSRSILLSGWVSDPREFAGKRPDPPR